eukprot:810298_1
MSKDVKSNPMNATALSLLNLGSSVQPASSKKFVEPIIRIPMGKVMLKKENFDGYQRRRLAKRTFSFSSEDEEYVPTRKAFRMSPVSDGHVDYDYDIGPPRRKRRMSPMSDGPLESDSDRTPPSPCRTPASAPLGGESYADKLLSRLKYTPEERRARVQRYRLKRKRMRVPHKYECRQRFASSRMRVNGRFITKDQEKSLKIMVEDMPAGKITIPVKRSASEEVISLTTRLSPPQRPASLSPSNVAGPGVRPAAFGLAMPLQSDQLIVNGQIPRHDELPIRQMRMSGFPNASTAPMVDQKFQPIVFDSVQPVFSPKSAPNINDRSMFTVMSQAGMVQSQAGMVQSQAGMVQSQAGMVQPKFSVSSTSPKSEPVTNDRAIVTAISQAGKISRAGQPPPHRAPVKIFIPASATRRHEIFGTPIRPRPILPRKVMGNQAMTEMIMDGGKGRGMWPVAVMPDRRFVLMQDGSGRPIRGPIRTVSLASDAVSRRPVSRAASPPTMDSIGSPPSLNSSILDGLLPPAEPPNDVRPPPRRDSPSLVECPS